METTYQRGIDQSKQWPNIQRGQCLLDKWSEDSHTTYKAKWAIADRPVQYKDGWTEEGHVVLELSLPQEGNDVFVIGVCEKAVDEQFVRGCWGDILRVSSHLQLKRINGKEGDDAADVGDHGGRDHAESGGPAS